MLRSILHDVDTNGDGQIDYNGNLLQLAPLITLKSGTCLRTLLP